MDFLVKMFIFQFRGHKQGQKKDRHHSTSGAKDGFSSIGSFSKTNIFGKFKIWNKKLRSKNFFYMQKLLNS